MKNETTMKQMLSLHRDLIPHCALSEVRNDLTLSTEDNLSVEVRFFKDNKNFSITLYMFNSLSQNTNKCKIIVDILSYPAKFDMYNQEFKKEFELTKIMHLKKPTPNGKFVDISSIDPNKLKVVPL